MKIKNNRWAVFICAFISVASTALTNIWSVFLNPLAEAYGCGISAVQLSYSFYALMQAVFGIISAALLKKISFRAIIIYGSACMTAGLAGLCLSNSVSGIFFSFSFLFGMGAGCVYTISVTNTLKWFPKNKGRISGMLLAAASIMGITMAPVVNSLIENIGIKPGCGVLAAGYFIVFSLTAWMAQPAPEYAGLSMAYSGTAEKIKNERNASAHDYTWQEMIKSPMFFIALAMFICANTGSVMMITSASSVAQAYTGLSAASSAAAVSAMSGFNLFGRLFFGWLSDKVGRIKVITFICILAFAVLSVLSLTSSQIVFIAGMCLIGMCGGALLANMPAVCSDCFGIKNSSINYSILFFGFAASSYAAPLIMSAFGKNYSAALLCAGVVCFAGAVLICILGYIQKNKRQFLS